MRNRSDWSRKEREKSASERWQHGILTQRARKVWNVTEISCCRICEEKWNNELTVSFGGNTYYCKGKERIGGQSIRVNQQSGTWRAKKNNRHEKAWDKDKECWTSHWQEKSHVCSHQNRHQDVSFASTVSSYLLITLAKISTFLRMSGRWGPNIFKDISLRLPLITVCVSSTVHSGICFCICLFLKQLGKPHAKHLI